MLQDLCILDMTIVSIKSPLLDLSPDIPWGSSVISSGATCPSLSFVAWTEELTPFANLEADWPMLRLAKPVWRDFQLAAISREGWLRNALSMLAACGGDAALRLRDGRKRRAVYTCIASASPAVLGVRHRLTRACTLRDAYAHNLHHPRSHTMAAASVYQGAGFDFSNTVRYANAIHPPSTYSRAYLFRNNFLEQRGLPLPKATSTGTTIVGCLFKDGIVLGADTRATEGPIVADKNCEKVRFPLTRRFDPLTHGHRFTSFQNPFAAVVLVQQQTQNLRQPSLRRIWRCTRCRPAESHG